jgi:hypothetical protein
MSPAGAPMAASAEELRASSSTSSWPAGLEPDDLIDRVEIVQSLRTDRP